MKIVVVDNKKSRKEFLELPVRLFSEEPHWIQPLSKDIESVFDPSVNTYFEHGECERWILVNDQQETIGRVAAFIDRKVSHKNDQPTGGMGFFECINNQQAANLLFDTCKAWLKERGMEAMDGPINFGERDRWWGLLVQGYEFDPNYCVPYNPPYYKTLIEHYGFREYFQQYTYYRTVTGGIDDHIRERAERILKNKDYTFNNISGKDINAVANDFREIYNKAWAGYGDAKEMSQGQVMALLASIKPIMDRKLIWMGYYQGQPIAFAVMLPEVNQVFKHLNGKLGWWEKLKFFWLMKQKRCSKILGVAFGVVPRFQRRGIESAIIYSISLMAYDSRNKFPYEDLEHNWVGDFNPQMMRVHEMMGGQIRKVHATYRYLFDRTKEFKRAEAVN